MCLDTHRYDLTTRLSSAVRTGRKTTKYKSSEAVWPQFLEEALMEGLEMYRPPPSSSRTSSRLQRFPKRNKIIAKYIYDKTGVIRKAKQVGSRLQQLRETSGDAYIQALITSRDFGRSSRRFSGPSSMTSQSALSPSSSRGTLSLRSSPSVNFSECEYDSSPCVSPCNVNASMEQQQDASLQLWLGSVPHQDNSNDIWDQNVHYQAASAPEYQYQQCEASSSTMAGPYYEQEFNGSVQQQMSYPAGLADISTVYGSSLDSYEYDISIGSYNTQPYSFDTLPLNLPTLDLNSSSTVFSTTAPRDSDEFIMYLPTPHL